MLPPSQRPISHHHINSIPFAGMQDRHQAFAGAREGLAMPWSRAEAKLRSAAQPDGASKPRLHIAAPAAGARPPRPGLSPSLPCCATARRVPRSCAAVRSAMGTKFTSIAGYPNNRINSTKKCDRLARCGVHYPVGAFTISLARWRSPIRRGQTLISWRYSIASRPNSQTKPGLLQPGAPQITAGSG